MYVKISVHKFKICAIQHIYVLGLCDARKSVSFPMFSAYMTWKRMHISHSNQSNILDCLLYMHTKLLYAYLYVYIYAWHSYTCSYIISFIGFLMDFWIWSNFCYNTDLRYKTLTQILSVDETCFLRPSHIYFLISLYSRVTWNPCSLQIHNSRLNFSFSVELFYF